LIIIFEKNTRSFPTVFPVIFNALIEFHLIISLIPPHLKVIRSIGIALVHNIFHSTLGSTKRGGLIVLAYFLTVWGKEGVRTKAMRRIVMEKTQQIAHILQSIINNPGATIGVGSATVARVFSPSRLKVAASQASAGAVPKALSLSLPPPVFAPQQAAEGAAAELLSPFQQAIALPQVGGLGREGVEGGLGRKENEKWEVDIMKERKNAEKEEQIEEKQGGKGKKGKGGKIKKKSGKGGKKGSEKRGEIKPKAKTRGGKRQERKNKRQEEIRAVYLL
jgi:hypothetical protein